MGNQKAHRSTSIGQVDVGFTLGLLYLTRIGIGKKPSVPIPLDIAIVRHRAAMQMTIGSDSGHHTEINILHEFGNSLLAEPQLFILLLASHLCSSLSPSEYALVNIS
jgi:hypothetical protein